MKSLKVLRFANPITELPPCEEGCGRLAPFEIYSAGFAVYLCATCFNNLQAEMATVYKARREER